MTDTAEAPVATPDQPTSTEEVKTVETNAAVASTPKKKRAKSSIKSRLASNLKQQVAPNERRTRTPAKHLNIASIGPEIKRKTGAVPVKTGKLGVKVAEMSATVAQLNKYKASSVELKFIHRLMFKTGGKATTLKKDIREFDGIRYDASQEDVIKKLSTAKNDAIKSTFDILCINKEGKQTKADLVPILAKWLMKPTMPEASADKPAKKKTTRKSSASARKPRKKRKVDDKAEKPEESPEPEDMEVEEKEDSTDEKAGKPEPEKVEINGKESSVEDESEAKETPEKHDSVEDESSAEKADTSDKSVESPEEPSLDQSEPSVEKSEPSGEKNEGESNEQPSTSVSAESSGLLDQSESVKDSAPLNEQPSEDTAALGNVTENSLLQSSPNSTSVEDDSINVTEKPSIMASSTSASLEEVSATESGILGSSSIDVSKN